MARVAERWLTVAGELAGCKGNGRLSSTVNSDLVTWAHVNLRTGYPNRSERFQGPVALQVGICIELTVATSESAIADQQVFVCHSIFVSNM